MWSASRRLRLRTLGRPACDALRRHATLLSPTLDWDFLLPCGPVRARGRAAAPLVFCSIFHAVTRRDRPAPPRPHATRRLPCVGVPRPCWCASRCAGARRGVRRAVRRVADEGRFSPLAARPADLSFPRAPLGPRGGLGGARRGAAKRDAANRPRGLESAWRADRPSSGTRPCRQGLENAKTRAKSRRAAGTRTPVGALPLHRRRLRHHSGSRAGPAGRSVARFFY